MGDARKKTEAVGGTERRTFTVPALELDDTSTSDTWLLSGWAAVTGTEYEVADWVEVVTPGAFKRTLAEPNLDVVLLTNHGEGGQLPLARTTSGTLRLSEDHRGLRVEADLDKQDPDAQQLHRKMQRGDLDGQMSMAFRVTAQSWSDDGTRRTIRGISLHRGDVSVVTMAASPTTSATIRAAQQAARPLPNHVRRARETMWLLSNGLAVPRAHSPRSTPTRYPRHASELELMRAAREVRASKYTAADLDRLADAGQAWRDPDGTVRLPVKDEEDLRAAIKQVHPPGTPAPLRRFVARRARELDLAHLVPNDWMPDGSRLDDPDDDDDNDRAAVKRESWLQHFVRRTGVYIPESMR